MPAVCLIDDAAGGGQRAGGENMGNVLAGITIPVTLGAGKRLSDGFGQSLELGHLGVRQSRFATFIDYRVNK
jgi:hypothetical protein